MNVTPDPPADTETIYEYYVRTARDQWSHRKTEEQIMREAVDNGALASLIAADHIGRLLAELHGEADERPSYSK